MQVISDRLSNQYRLIIFNAKELDEDIFQYVKKLNESNRDIGKPIVLLVDDADEYGNQLRFISFLGFLRNNYLEREKFGQKSTIHSVILACKQDIRNIVVYNSFGDRVKNSPWNIAADFNVDMTFHPEEIAQMLRDYENDKHTRQGRRLPRHVRLFEEQGGERAGMDRVERETDLRGGDIVSS